MASPDSGHRQQAQKENQGGKDARIDAVNQSGGGDGAEGEGGGPIVHCCVIGVCRSAGRGRSGDGRRLQAVFDFEKEAPVDGGEAAEIEPSVENDGDRFIVVDLQGVLEFDQFQIIFRDADVVMVQHIAAGEPFCQPRQYQSFDFGAFVAAGLVKKIDRHRLGGGQAAGQQEHQENRCQKASADGLPAGPG